MGVLHSFARRVLMQAVVSSTVMAGLQVAVHFGPEVFLPRVRAAGVERPDTASSGTTDNAAPTDKVASAITFAQDRTSGDVKTDRLPIWSERKETDATVSGRRLASKDRSMGVGDVMLFDQCRPGCESKDPLLAFNKQPTATPSPIPAMVPEVLDDIAVSSVPDPADADSDENVPPPEGIVAVATHGSVFVARRIASVVGW